MEEKLFEPLKKRIEQEGANLGNGILKVDPFINHQVDPYLMEACGQALADLFRMTHPSKILTAEISGIAPALMTAKFLGIPVVYARKHKPITMSNMVYLTVAPSHTKGIVTELIVSPEYLPHGERVLIIDDFLASGATISGLVRLIQTAGATLVGIGTLIEKAFEEGREMLSPLNVPIHSLVSISSMENGQILFSEN
jgi:xanthine phosphoribosyltransferase